MTDSKDAKLSGGHTQTTDHRRDGAAYSPRAQVSFDWQLAGSDAGEKAKNASSHRLGQPDGAPTLGDDDERRGFQGSGIGRSGVNKHEAMG